MYVSETNWLPKVPPNHRWWLPIWPFEKRWPFVAQAVRVGNYYAEDQEEVLRYIAEVHLQYLVIKQILPSGKLT